MMLTHKGTVTLTTKRLALRRFKMNDVQATYHNLASDERVTEYLSWDIHKSPEATAELLVKWTHEEEVIKFAFELLGMHKIVK